MDSGYAKSADTSWDRYSATVRRTNQRQDRHRHRHRHQRQRQHQHRHRHWIVMKWEVGSGANLTEIQIQPWIVMPHLLWRGAPRVRTSVHELWVRLVIWCWRGCGCWRGCWCRCWCWCWCWCCLRPSTSRTGTASRCGTRPRARAGAFTRYVHREASRTLDSLTRRPGTGSILCIRRADLQGRCASAVPCDSFLSRKGTKVRTSCASRYCRCAACTSWRGGAARGCSTRTRARGAHSASETQPRPRSAARVCTTAGVPRATESSRVRQ